MTLTDPGFLFVFVPLFLCLFAISGRLAGARGAQSVLVLASILLAATNGLPFLVVMLASACVNYGFLRLILSSGREKHGNLLLIGIGMNVLLLILFKYAVWLNWLGGLGDWAMRLAVLVPTTLSFLTFQRSVGLLDASVDSRAIRQGLEARHVRDQSEAPVADGALRYLGFATLFPNLVMGPIAYLSEILPQFLRDDFGRIRRINLLIGVTLIAIGLFKKLFIADPLGEALVNPVFALLAEGNSVPRLNAVLAVTGWYAQLYFDFSGYSDIAIGLARLFGIRLPMNFDSPLRATGIIDFYKRWHITLTRVISRFLFTPLSVAGTRLAFRRKLGKWSAKGISLWLPLLVNFIVIGLWHGPKQTYLLFGLIHGLWYIAETEVRATKRWKSFRKAKSERFRFLSGLALTTIPLMLTFALFRAGSLGELGLLFQSLADGAQNSTNPIPIVYFVRLGAAFALIAFAPNAYELLERYRPAIRSYTVPSTTLGLLALRWRPNLVWATFIALIALAAMDKLARPAPFIYGVF